MKQWLVAYVRLYHEKKTRDRLKEMNIECFLPIQEETHQWSDRKKKIERIVIPMMIFIHIEPQERQLPLTLSSVNRYLVLRGESSPAVIPDKQMDQFRFMLDYSEEAVEMCNQKLEPGQKIRVIKGSMTGFEGELVKIGSKNKLVVSLNILGYATVDIPIGFIEKIE
ncbi:MAG: UpxY family transcription antiterminator [Bacteroidaceae bacterium]|nr:UpxY family transcription antiterminator [Bacteroidaceae bacterium]